MASSSLTPYKSNSAQETFALISQSADGAIYRVSGRALSLPYQIDMQRKLNPSGTGNDHVGYRISRVEKNATTGKLATLQVLVDVSIPKDISVLDLNTQKEICAITASILNEQTAMEATNVKISALLAGGDF